MELNKFQRILWTTNGVFIFLLGAFLLFVSMKEFYEYLDRFDTKTEVIVGEELEKAKKDGMVLQKLTHDYPIKLAYSDNYILPVKVATYKNPKSQSSGGGYDGNALRVERTMPNTVNIIFLDRNLVVKKSLLSRKAFISDFRYPGESRSDYEERYIATKLDTVTHYLTYEITFDDSNKDGAINDEDDKDLYISAMDGSDLTQVTKGFDISSYRFISSNKILIFYTKREDIQPDNEHKKEYCSVYSVNTKLLDNLSPLEKEMEKLEKLITQ